ncbi:MAG: hypothetical protein A3E83_02565 [Gammaproteobacteria bacterium RIFCSPHIGHO2_12_FULL_41_20]|nr:MAG: hypothetical protein A3E83_02565 [Gammaproteobacteria bacterium RIFCSPHIGHO2_12_FULL_41_20]
MIRMEKEIMQCWQYQDPLLVSIVCFSYNLERYIEDAIKSFLVQETTFPFEIIIHDDASIDSTQEIIKDYVKKYPNLIKPIFQKENQCSQPGKNFRFIQTMVLPQARGKYVALCDGDDCWIDANKLQIQVEEMQKNPKCHISFHPILLRSDHKPDKIVANHTSHQKIYPVRKVILGGALFCHTSATMIKKDVIDNLPKWYFDVQIGDYFLQILAALPSGALYINKVMSVYRTDTINGWSEKMAKEKNRVYNYFIGMLASLADVDAYTNFEYMSEFNIIRRKLCFSMCRNPVFSLEERREIYLQYRDKLDLKDKIIWYLVYNNQLIFKWVHKLEKQIRRSPLISR